jgi:dipeptidyl aminopeptidase/acylaminoacyl peptidase
VPALFTSRGYALLGPDVPYTCHEPAADIARAVIPALDAAVATGVIDGDRLGVFGHSAGGYAVNVLITRTQRFAAAVSCQGYCDFMGHYLVGGPAGPTYQAHVETILMGGTLWDHPDRYVRNSPVFSLPAVTTPLLLICGENDPGFPEQAWEMFHGLSRLGKEVTLASYKDADHYYGFWSTEQIIDFWDRVLGWFDEHFVTR